jgi:hypothetical protein
MESQVYTRSLEGLITRQVGNIEAFTKYKATTEMVTLIHSESMSDMAYGWDHHITLVLPIHIQVA